MKKRQFPNKRQVQKTQARHPSTTIVREVLAARMIEPKKVYGQPFILLEDEKLDTFHYVRGAWVPYEKRIAECRVDCKVNVLPQKLNKMTRYEIRAQII